MTCPTAREISQAMASAGLGDLPQACSLEQLLERCLDAFDPDGRLHGGEYAVDLTLTTHGWVVPSAELARRLLALYQEALRDGREERALRICHFVRHWALQHPDSFLLEPALAEVVAELRRAALHEGREGHARLLDTSHVARTAGATCSGGGRGAARRWRGRWRCAMGSPTGCSSWCSPPQPHPASSGPGQAHTDHAEAAGAAELQHADGRGGGVLPASHLAPPRHPRPAAPEVAKALSAMAELVSSRGNFGAYRRAFAACRGFRLPLLPVHLKDLAALDAALPGRLPGGRLHLPKLLGLYQHARDLRALQRLAPPFRADPQLLGLLALSLHTLHTEEDLLRLSHAREPGCSRLLGTSAPPPALLEELAQLREERDRLLEENRRLRPPPPLGAMGGPPNSPL
ncbi:RAS guanyl-releasing protein 4 [Anas platyrhynchos]|uniref:RAS guanyl-releasing protein 4 n=1 Tax=Anas platyrhynchos TaxID=8839 RepID=UPI003AF2D7AB